jgi:hypothetical protein
MDDAWLDDGPSVPAGGVGDPMVAQNWNRITTKYSDVGYREGISEGKLSSLQEGFDQSFKMSVPLVRRLGNLRGAASALLAYMTGMSATDYVLVEKVRALISDLGRIKVADVLPVDQEALDHANEHMGDDNEDLPREKKELDDLVSAFDVMAGQKVDGVAGDRLQREDELLSLLEKRFDALQQSAGLV